MNPTWENRNSAGAQGHDGTSGARELPELENTLRLIATVPVPEGLEERVHAALKVAPRGARVLAWPTALRPQAAWLGSGWARTAAAAAIVFIVAGGGWGVYLRVPHSSKVVVMPAQKAGGFSSAGAIHTPDSIQGPVITNRGPVITNPLTAKPSAHSKTHPGKLKVKRAETANPTAPNAVPDAAPNPVSTVTPAASTIAPAAASAQR